MKTRIMSFLSTLVFDRPRISHPMLLVRLSGPGGIGKTYLRDLIVDHYREQGKQANWIITDGQSDAEIVEWADRHRPDVLIVEMLGHPKKLMP